MLVITPSLCIEDSEIDMSAIRAAGNGGQNVNKVSSAIHLRFDIGQSSLPDKYKQRLLAMSDSRISKDGVLILKAQSYRTQELNKDDALARLKSLILAVTKEEKPRKPSRPSLSARKKRTDAKKRDGFTKALRGKVSKSDY